MKRLDIVLSVILVFGLFILLIGFCLYAQEIINNQAWNDFKNLRNDIKAVKHQLSSTYERIRDLDEFANEILNDNDRKAELKKLIDQHPDYDLSDIQSRVQKLRALKQWLEDNDYVVIE